MIRDLIVDPSAQADVRSVFENYEKQESGRGFRFEAALDGLLERVRLFPQSSPVVRQHVRRAVMHGYPFSVFYIEENDRIFVLAVIHQSRDPDIWPVR